jgi:hypothetical protein
MVLNVTQGADLNLVAESNSLGSGTLAFLTCRSARCSAHGACSLSGACSCDAGYSGSDCSVCMYQLIKRERERKREEA